MYSLTDLAGYIKACVRGLNPKFLEYRSATLSTEPSVSDRPRRSIHV